LRIIFKHILPNILKISKEKFSNWISYSN
jgi:ABC-type dipeptide/oligopeptide/nickel transport system permease subunit